MLKIKSSEIKRKTSSFCNRASAAFFVLAIFLPSRYRDVVRDGHSRWRILDLTTRTLSSHKTFGIRTFYGLKNSSMHLPKGGRVLKAVCYGRFERGRLMGKRASKSDVCVRLYT